MRKKAEPLRSFGESGAVRTSDDGKLDVMHTLDPLVLRRVAKYLTDARVRNKIEPGNWKRGIPRKALMESLLRHVLDVWSHLARALEGRAVVDIEPQPDLEDELCALIFNASGLLREVLLDRDNEVRK